MKDIEDLGFDFSEKLHKQIGKNVKKIRKEKKVSQLKTGFYYIALKAEVPIIPVAFDFGKKEVNLGKPFFPTSNYEADLNELKKHFVGVEGKIPTNGYDW